MQIAVAQEIDIDEMVALDAPSEWEREPTELDHSNGQGAPWLWSSSRDSTRRISPNAQSFL